MASCGIYLSIGGGSYHLVNIQCCACRLSPKRVPSFSVSLRKRGGPATPGFLKVETSLLRMQPVALEGLQNDQHLLLNDWFYDSHGCLSVTPTCRFMKSPFTQGTLPVLRFHCSCFSCFYHLSIFLPLFLYPPFVGSECLCPPEIHRLILSPQGDSIGR